MDPGHTTGWALFVNGELERAGQILPAEGGGPDLLEHYKLIVFEAPDVLVYERFALYAGKAQDLIHSTFPTVEAIGVIKLGVMLLHTPCELVTYPAGTVKAFFTNDRLKELGLLQQPAHELRHANDALRHGCYYLVFGK